MFGGGEALFKREEPFFRSARQNGDTVDDAVPHVVTDNVFDGFVVVHHSTTYLLRKRMVRTYISGLMFFLLGEKKLRMVQVMMPAHFGS